mgnify:CR=1 FL=1
MPTYETFGRGCEFLEFQFEKFINQTFKDFEVVISDHSNNSDIKKLCERYSDKLSIVYIHNPLQRGSLSHNTNNAINNCKRKIIKILFQDDFLFDEEITSGVNTIGNPSVVAFRNLEDNVLFDEKMTWTVDLDYYKRMHNRHGVPKVIEDTIVVIRIWDRQLTNLIPHGIKQKEEKIIRDRYAKT